jgi:site-specific DNA-methyltransferase (adenine-specific)
MKEYLKITNEDNMELMARYPDNYFELAIVDPPYGINQDKVQENLSNKKGFTKNAGTYKEYHKTEWDNEVPNLEYFKELQRVSKNQIVWGGNYFHKLNLEGVIIWYKGNSGNFKEGELAKTNINTFKVYKYSRADAYINDCDNKIHPTQKPVKLYEWILTNYAEPNFKILDTHLGSGSIAIAVDSVNKIEKMNLTLTACELDTEYYQTATQRIKEQTTWNSLF